MSTEPSMSLSSHTDKLRVCLYHMLSEIIIKRKQSIDLSVSAKHLQSSRPRSPSSMRAMAVDERMDGWTDGDVVGG